MTCIAVMLKSGELLRLDTSSSVDAALETYSPDVALYGVRLPPASAETVKELLTARQASKALRWLKMMALSFERLR